MNTPCAKEMKMEDFMETLLAFETRLNRKIENTIKWEVGRISTGLDIKLDTRFNDFEVVRALERIEEEMVTKDDLEEVVEQLDEIEEHLIT